MHTRTSRTLTNWSNMWTRSVAVCQHLYVCHPVHHVPHLPHFSSSSSLLTLYHHPSLLPPHQHLIITFTPHIITLTPHTSLLPHRMVVYTPSTPPPLATLMQSMQPTRHGHWRQTISSPTLMDPIITGLATSPVDLLSKGTLVCVTTSFKPANSWRPLAMDTQMFPQLVCVSDLYDVLPCVCCYSYSLRVILMMLWLFELCATRFQDVTNCPDNKSSDTYGPSIIMSYTWYVVLPAHIWRQNWITFFQSSSFLQILVFVYQAIITIETVWSFGLRTSTFLC